MNIASYVTILDNLKEILESKDPETINLFVCFASGLNSIFWLGYSVLTEDIYIFVPCFVGMIVFVIQMILFMWTLGTFEDSCCFVYFLHRSIIGKNKGIKKKQKGD